MIDEKHGYFKSDKGCVHQSFPLKKHGWENETEEEILLGLYEIATGIW